MAALRNFPMIEDIWNRLQDYITLKVIYEKLPHDDLFRVRLVCKEWNHAALQRLLPKPSFVTIITWTRAIEAYYSNKVLNNLHGLISTYNVDGDDSTSLTFHSLRFHIRLKESHVPPFEVKGLILCHNPNNVEERGVFNVHTRTWHAIPAAPYTTSDGRISVCALIVDTTVRPFTFKLVEGFAGIKTQIYDSKSRSWSTTSSQLHEDREYPMNYTCVCRNGTAYMSVGENTILKYSMEADLWSTLQFPVVIGEPLHNTLGLWEGRMFSARENPKERRVTVWELVDEERQEWVEYARMSEKMCQWLYASADSESEDDDYEINREYVRPFNRDGYFLFCMVGHFSAAALVLFNMRTKQWHNVQWPVEQKQTYILSVDRYRDPWKFFDEQEKLKNSINTLEDID